MQDQTPASANELTKLEELVYQARRQEIAQRSSFQHAYVILNVAATGSILAFALRETSADPDRVTTALLVPGLSFVLFVLWLHQAIVINTMGDYLRRALTDPWEAYKETDKTRERFRRATILAGLSLNFGGAPALALFVFASGADVEGTTAIAVAAIGVGLMGLVLGGIGYWAWDSYWKNRDA